MKRAFALRLAIAGFALGLGAPALAQPPAPAASEAAPEPDRLAAAERLLAIMFPEGAMQTMIGAMPDSEWLLDMRVGDFPLPPEAREGASDPDQTFAEAMAARDPHFRERMRITNQVMRAGLAEIFGEMEPDFRALVAELYARRFTAAELDEMAGFFATGVGARFVRESMTLTHDPQYLIAMQRIMPRFAAAMGPIMERVRAATAHLPAPGVGTDEE